MYIIFKLSGFVCDVAMVWTFMLQLLELFLVFFKCSGMELLANMLFYKTVILYLTSLVLRF